MALSKIITFNPPTFTFFQSLITWKRCILEKKYSDPFCSKWPKEHKNYNLLKKLFKHFYPNISSRNLQILRGHLWAESTKQPNRKNYPNGSGLTSWSISIVTFIISSIKILASHYLLTKWVFLIVFKKIKNFFV